MSITGSRSNLETLNKTHTIVSVIASFDTTGKTRPLYVRIGETAYKVYSYSQCPDYDPNMSFYCQVCDNDTLKPLRLQYLGRDNVWIIPYGSSQITS